MRRILIFSLVYYPRFIGGAEIAIKEITDRISSEEIEFDMVTLRLDSKLPRYEKIGNVNVYRVGWAGKQKMPSDSLPWYLHLNKYALMFTGFFRAVSLSKTRKYEAIWSMMATYNSFAALFFKLTHPRIPFILTLQEGDPIPYIKKRALPLYPLFKMIFTHADHIQTISKYLADWAKDMGAKCPITVVPNAVDYQLFSKKESAEEEELLKKRLGKNESDVFLITTSRLVIKNAVGDIIDSLQYLGGNVKLLILGQGYEEGMLRKQAQDVSLVTSVADLAETVSTTSPTTFPRDESPHAVKSRGNVSASSRDCFRIDACDDLPAVSGRVQFLGFVPHNEMPKYLHISDIFIRPSLSEGFGNSFIEAMAAGIPVIATPVGGIVDFLVDGETGLFCEVKNPKSIAQKIEKLIKDKESREYIVRNAKKMVEEQYGWGKIAREMKEIFSKVRPR